MTPQWFILMAKLLIYQIRFQSARSCAKAGPRKENPFVGWGVKFQMWGQTSLLQKKKRKRYDTV